MKILKQIVLDSGSDPMDWSADERREAVIELFEGDPKGDWISDCMSELAYRDNERASLIAALKHDSPTMRHCAIGIIVERFLLNFPLDSLQRTAEEHETDWTRSAA